MQLWRHKENAATNVSILPSNSLERTGDAALIARDGCYLRSCRSQRSVRGQFNDLCKGQCGCATLD